MSGPQPRVSSRDALLDALSLLLEADPEGTIPGVDAITAGAGLAHGTFYRYFPNKENALDSLVRRVRLEIASVRPRADKPPASRDEARRAIRTWIARACREPSERPGVVRAWLRRTLIDPCLGQEKAEMLAEAARDMTAYLEELDRLGFAAIDSPEPIAKALILLIHGAFRLVIDKQPLDDSTLSGIAHIADRAIFGSEVAPAYLAE